MIKNREDKIEKFIEHELLTNKKMIRTSLLRLSKNMHVLFGKYGIRKDNDVYVVFTSFSDRELTFSSLRTAITWCVFHEKTKLAECSLIQILDSKIVSIDAEIAQNSKLVSNAKNKETRELYDIKADDYRARKHDLSRQLDVFINMSVAWQQCRYDLTKLKTKDKYFTK